MGNTLTDFGGIVEGVVVPTLNNQFDKAWNACYANLVLPAQRDIISSLLLDMLDRHYVSQNLKPDGEVHLRGRLTDR